MYEVIALGALILKQRVDNLEFKAYNDIRIQDIRDSRIKVSLDKCRFQLIPRQTKNFSFETVEAVARYKSETEDLLGRPLAWCTSHATTCNSEGLYYSNALE